MVKPTCPHNEQLASFVRCELSEEVAANVLDHLDHCPHCEETVAKLEVTIKSVLPGAAPTMISMPYAEESACQRAVQTLVNEFTAAASEASPVIDAKPPAASNQQSDFQTLRDFRIVEKVGQGGMGAVYKAVHQRMQRTVALKVLPSGMIGDQSAIARFNREMSVLGQLNHPNIVQAFDAGEHDGQHYLAMEFIEGQDLASMLRKHGRLTVANASLIISQVSNALQYAHEKGFVHRDIKPSNLMLAKALGADGNPQAIVKVLDLGLARVFDQRAPQEDSPVPELTSAGQIMGTLDYMAPEQGSDSHQVDIRTDIYSLGATFYKLLTGEAPFAEHAGKAPIQRLMAIATLDVPSITAIRPDVPEKLAKVVHRMLEKDPARRFQIPLEVSKALEELTSGASLIELLQPEIGAKAEPAKLASIPASSGHTGDGRRFSKRFLASMGGFAAFIALSALLVLTTRHGRIEVTSPDGQLPKDLSIVVLKGGQEVQVLQADNLWTATLVNGEYEVALRGGNDQFEIQDSKLTVTRLGKAVCIVTHIPVSQTDERPEKPVDTPATNSTSVVASEDAEPKGVIAAESPARIADRDKPFVVVDEAGKTIAEYRFANETFAAPQNGVIEVHGNGPFRLGQVRREGGSLHIRAGKGYRPRFVVGFDLPEPHGETHWLNLTNVNLTVEGCDFHGARAFQFCQFVGSGGQWTLRNCRIVQPATEGGIVLRFSGDVIAIENSLMCNPSPTSALLHLLDTRVSSLSGNILIGPVYLSQGVEQNLTLKANVLFNSSICLVQPQTNLEKLTIEATDNHFFPPFYALISSATKSSPKQHVLWKGDGNHFVPFAKHSLWGWIGEEGEDPGLNEIADWNGYWGNANDLTAGSPMRFTWDLFNQPDWADSLEQIEAELVAARLKFPTLVDLGPDFSLVGPGAGWNETLRLSQTSEFKSRPDAPEGGPFVVIRDRLELAGHLSFSDALQETQAGDIIEVRSDGTFPAIYVGDGVARRLTLRAAAGYRPAFAGFTAETNSGDWTLEGLHFLTVAGKPSLSCATQRISNCSMEYAAADGRIQLRCPDGADSLELVNCYFPNHSQIIGSSIKIVNSVFSTVETGLPENLSDSTESSIDVEHSCLWTHTTPTRPMAGTVVDARSKQRLHVTDSLIDAGNVTYGPTITWSGERNLYRTYGPYESKPVTDDSSMRDDSAFLRTQLWQRN